MCTRPHVNRLKAALDGMTETAPAAKEVALASSNAHASSLPPSRQGERIVWAYVDPAASLQLRQMALEHRSSVQALVEEALNDLFVKHHKSPIA